MNQDQELDKLLEAYRSACPDVNPSTNFMPNLWARIDSRRRSEMFVWRWANGFAGAAGLLVLVLGVMLYQSAEPLQQRAYIEKLTDEISEDHFLDASYIATARTVRFGGAR